MKVLVFSPQGDGVGLALQLMSEGHQVAVHFVDENDAKQGKGMIWQSQDWQADARQADFVLFDNNSRGGYADNLRKDGIKVWNGGVIADRLESDRPFGMAVMRKAGIPIPETWDFKNYAEARKLIEAEFEDKERPVIKMNDNAGCATSYVGRDKEDVLHTIEAWDRDALVDLSKGGIVQRKIEGSEISVEGWWNGSEFMYPYNITLERKKLLNGDKGPNTGCSWNFVQNLKPRRPRIAREFLEPLAPLLKKGYVGQIDVNMIVDDDGSGRRLTLKDGARVELDFLGSEAGARGHHGIDIHHDGRAADGILDAVLHIRNALDLFDLVGDLWRPSLEQCRVGGEQFDLDGFG